MKKYEVGVVSGKFRLLNKGHKELLIRATLEEVNKLVIVVFDLQHINRFSTISELRVAIGEILKDVSMPYEIIIVKKEYENIENFEKFLIGEIGHDSILMFNSKTIYENVLLDNAYIDCENSGIVSSDIEQNIYNIRSYEKLAKEFMPYVNKKIVLSGVESSGKTQFCIKLAKSLNTIYSEEYGRNYANKHLGGDDEAFTPKDFIFIAQNQLHQDRKRNKEARRFLIIDTDPFVTLRFLKSYYEEYEKRGIITNEFLKEYEGAKSILEAICSTYKSDIIFLLRPNNEYVIDGVRWSDQTQLERNKRFEELREIYDDFNQKYIIVEGTSYSKKFNFVEKKLKEIMDTC